jgi:hypothetical protein
MLRQAVFAGCVGQRALASLGSSIRWLSAQAQPVEEDASGEWEGARALLWPSHGPCAVATGSIASQKTSWVPAVSLIGPAAAQRGKTRGRHALRCALARAARGVAAFPRPAGARRAYVAAGSRRFGGPGAQAARSGRLPNPVFGCPFPPPHPCQGSIEMKGIQLRGAPMYLDMQATTPMDPRVLDAMLPYMVDQARGPSRGGGSSDWQGRAASLVRQLRLPPFVRLRLGELVLAHVGCDEPAAGRQGRRLWRCACAAAPRSCNAAGPPSTAPCPSAVWQPALAHAHVRLGERGRGGEGTEAGEGP